MTIDDIIESVMQTVADIEGTTNPEGFLFLPYIDVQNSVSTKLHSTLTTFLEEKARELMVNRRKDLHCPRHVPCKSCSDLYAEYDAALLRKEFKS